MNPKHLQIIIRAVKLNLISLTEALDLIYSHDVHAPSALSAVTDRGK